MSLHPIDLMEPEETVGNLWHDYASKIGAQEGYGDAAVTLTDVRPSLAMLFRALGGPSAVEIGEAPMVRSPHRLKAARKLGTTGERMMLARYDGERLGLPAVMEVFPSAHLNRAAYMWLTALAANVELSAKSGNGFQQDCASLRQLADATVRTIQKCPGLRQPYAEMCGHVLQARSRPHLPKHEATVETAIVEFLSTGAFHLPDTSGQPPKGYLSFEPIPIWLNLPQPTANSANAEQDEAAEGPPPMAAATSRKMASRENRDEANRTDSFIIHRFEAILSWVESMNLNRSVDDDEDEDVQKAADDQDQITLSRHDDKKAATRLRMHLDLSPADADHERLAGEFTYPEWNHRQRAYMPDHTRVLEVEADTDTPNAFQPDPRRLREVRRQFEALHPRRIMRPRQIEGSELDLDALIAAQVDLRATGSSSDRIYQSLRQTDRDLSVAFLLDGSRSTEAAVGDTCVADVARESLSALAGGIDASGDRLGIWGFSSLRRDRVFIKCCKGFDTPMSADVTRRICGITPCHYTRLGAAIRHASAHLSNEQSTRKLLLVLTDGKPNDLDHYEGIHGIEDSHMAVREARRLGQTVHGIIIDEDGQDWFTRIFGRGGFTLLPEPARLTRALPEIYRSLVQET